MRCLILVCQINPQSGRLTIEVERLW